jgi:membrane associated rhomboid family serine protease
MIPIRNAVPSRYPPVITWMLITTNCLVFLFQDSLNSERYSEVLAPGDTDLAAVDILPFFSVLFLHGGWLHLIFNMWTLWLFGPTIEDRLGHGRYLAFYLACLAASVAHVMFNPTSIVPALGASPQSPAFSGATCVCFHWRGSSWLSQSCSAVRRSQRVCLYRSVIPASDFAVGDGTSAATVERRHRVVEPMSEGS